MKNVILSIVILLSLIQTANSQDSLIILKDSIAQLSDKNGKSWKRNKELVAENEELKSKILDFKKGDTTAFNNFFDTIKVLQNLRIENQKEIDALKNEMSILKHEADSLNKVIAENKKLISQRANPLFIYLFIISTIALIIVAFVLIKKKMNNKDTSEKKEETHHKEVDSVLENEENTDIENCPKDNNKTIETKKNEKVEKEIKPVVNQGQTSLGFHFNMEKIIGKGEDSNPIFINEAQNGLIGVFDGLGGAGATKYKIRNSEYTGAYLASRFVKRIIVNYYQQGERFLFKKDALKKIVLTGLEDRAIRFEIKPSRLKSKLIKTLPTTAALIYYQIINENQVKTEIAWAGDSRCFTLDSKFGLMQMSKDDLVNYGDALQNLKIDSPISNCISIDSSFEFNYDKQIINKPVILIAATDGAFGYLKSPMHFEYLLISSLQSATSMELWQSSIQKELKDVAGDDVSIALISIGFSDFSQLKNIFAQRTEELQKQYIDKINKAHNNENETILDCWETYKINYEKNL